MKEDGWIRIVTERWVYMLMDAEIFEALNTTRRIQRLSDVKELLREREALEATTGRMEKLWSVNAAECKCR